ncbi:leucyl/phenylalanyl-tRNA--protein transferase [Halopseudomonas maritima]|uniref:leucyl/phenylalanyl-tRNA--protein transferase n=1 Tax=Halopseudomonas maritima TaxID=2918528 RepID=UPI001EEC07D7|nr:leucyl/phenylalanyl-tRNA--protein transferase [Halopseudomonas maritima]UJJ31664.1 leucyl/phenylalanyl-tRNA--protein transferase [Halopseudomonas maritima]
MPPLTWLTADNQDFPAVERAFAEPNGLLAAGGDLRPQRLLSAYRQGIFPWFSPGQPILWWSPDPRTVLHPSDLHVSRSMRKLMRQTHLRVEFDRNFPAVIAACAAPRQGASGTWITETMQSAYIALHRLGHAHCVEVYQDEQLVGGLYGIALGRVFFGESMFSRIDNASKLAFITLVQQLEQWGFELIDCQMPTDHLFSLGASSLPRAQFSAELARLCPAGAPSAWGGTLR